MSTVDIVKGVTEALGGKGISLQSDRLSTKQHTCSVEVCEWKEQRIEWVVDSGYNWPFRKWLAYEVSVWIVFEHNGCDINDARLVLSSGSFTRWYSDKATFQITAKGGESKRPGPSGCPTCCKAGSVVTFDVSLDTKFDFVRTDNRSWLMTIGADGTVNIVDR